MSEKAYSTSDLSRKSGYIIADAMRRPVTITQRNKPRLVILIIEDYESMRKRAETRTSGTMNTMPASLADELEQSIETHAADEDSDQR